MLSRSEIDAVITIARDQSAMGLRSNALKILEEVSRMAPSDGMLLLELAIVRLDGGDDHGGEDALRRALSHGMPVGLPELLLGEVVLRNGRVEEGRALIEAALGANTLPPTLASRGRLILGGIGRSVVKPSATPETVGAEACPVRAELLGGRLFG